MNRNDTAPGGVTRPVPAAGSAGPGTFARAALRAVGHLVIRDKDTREVIVNKRDAESLA